MRKCKAKRYQKQQKARQIFLFYINDTFISDIVAQGMKTFGYRELVVNRYQTIKYKRISSIQTLKKKKKNFFVFSFSLTHLYVAKTSGESPPHIRNLPVSSFHSHTPKKKYLEAKLSYHIVGPSSTSSAVRRRPNGGQTTTNLLIFHSVII